MSTRSGGAADESQNFTPARLSPTNVCHMHPAFRSSSFSSHSLAIYKSSDARPLHPLLLLRETAWGIADQRHSDARAATGRLEWRRTSITPATLSRSVGVNWSSFQRNETVEGPHQISWNCRDRRSSSAMKMRWALFFLFILLWVVVHSNVRLKMLCSWAGADCFCLGRDSLGAGNMFDCVLLLFYICLMGRGLLRLVFFKRIVYLLCWLAYLGLGSVGLKL